MSMSRGLNRGLNTGFGGGVPVEDGPLALLDNVFAAYAFRQLSSLRSNLPSVKIRRDGPSPASEDFGVDGNGDFDQAAADAFVGANTGFIETWYDHSPSGFDISEVSATKQCTYNIGIPTFGACGFLANTRYMSMSIPGGSEPEVDGITLICGFRQSTAGLNQHMMSAEDDSGTTKSTISKNNSDERYEALSTTQAVDSPGLGTFQAKVWSTILDGTTVRGYVNGTEVATSATAAVTTKNITDIHLGSQNGLAGSQIIGNAAEFIFAGNKDVTKHGNMVQDLIDYYGVT